MSKEKLGQEPAFANNNTNGMSKRFYAACAAMQGLLANSNVKDLQYSFEDIIPKLAFMYADELLRQENE